MKFQVFIAFFLLQVTFAQNLSKEKLKAKMSKEICTDLQAKNITKTNFEMTVGISLMKTIKANKVNVEKHYGNNMYGKNGYLEVIGEDLGELMIENCPDVFEKFYDSGALDKYFEEEDDKIILDSISTENPDVTNEGSETNYELVDEETLQVFGTFLGTKLDGFLLVTVKEDSGKLNNFILLDKFENAYLILDKVVKLNDKISVNYYESNLLNTKTNEFSNYKIITDILINSETKK